MGDAIGVQLLDLGRHDHATTTTEHLDVLATIGLEQIDHVLEELDVTTLVAGDGNALYVFLQRSGDDFAHRAVVTEMNDFRAGRLQDATHDVD